VVIQPLSLPEMYVVAAILESSDADLDGLSIARDALACCTQLISKTAVYRTLDRLERRHVVTWEQAEEGHALTVRSDRRYMVTTEGRTVFDRSLGLMPIEDRGRIALNAKQFQADDRSLICLNEDEDT
jgi:DNA-binding PadR family transcriptional regulator